MEKEIKLIYVFDGEPPSLKEMEIKRRTKVKEEALIKYEEALRRGALDEAKRYAQVTAQLKDYMVEDTTRLLDLMGIPWVQAPSEGEAQAAHIAAKGDVWAAASQDYDSLLFGAPRLVRNITITGKRKLPRKEVYIEVVPEVVELNQVLSELSITRELLVDIGILIGTDYNPGVKGIGPKTALKLVKEHGSLEKISSKIEEVGPDAKLDQIRSIFLKPTVTDAYQLKWKPPDTSGIIDFLCYERDFSEDRVRVALEKATAGIKEGKGKVTLESWLN